MKKRFIALLAGALAAATLLSACGGGNDGNNGDTPGGAPAQSSAPAGEQVLRVSMAGAPSDVGPLTSTTTEGAELLGCMFEGLVRKDA